MYRAVLRVQSERPAAFGQVQLLPCPVARDILRGAQSSHAVGPYLEPSLVWTCGLKLRRLLPMQVGGAEDVHAELRAARGHRGVVALLSMGLLRWFDAAVAYQRDGGDQRADHAEHQPCAVISTPFHDATSFCGQLAVVPVSDGSNAWVQPP